MFEIAYKQGMVNNRDEMRSKINSQKYRELQTESARQIYNLKFQKIIVDTHCTIVKPEGYYPGLPIWVLDMLKPKLIVIIESKPEDIIKRRNYDQSRQRDKVSVEKIIEHQNLNRATAMAYSVLTGAPIKVIFNIQGKIDYAASELAIALNNLS
jgi:adenylate kinase